MKLTYRIWDKQSPINSCPAKKAMTSLKITKNDEVYIIVNENGADWIVQTKLNAPYPGATIEESAQNHINMLLKEHQKETAGEQVEA